MSSAVVLSHSMSDHLGGAERSLLTVLEEWKRADPMVNPLVVSPGPGAMHSAVSARGYRTAIIDMSGWTVSSEAGGSAARELRSRQNARATRELLRLLDDELPDLVVTNTLVHPWAAIAAASRGIPHVWFVREFGEESQGFRWPEGRQEAIADIAAMSTAVVVNSRAVASMFDDTAGGTPVIVSFPPVDVDAVRLRAGESVELEEPDAPVLRVGVLGRVTRSKGQWRLIEALAHVHARGIELRMVGAVLDPGAERELTLRARALAPHVRVCFDGERDNPFPLLAACDVAVIPSDKEAFGRSTLECLALGLPVVTTSSGAGAELVIDGHCGRLVDPDDFAELGRALDDYAASEALRASHSEAARNRADEIVSGADSIVTAIETLRAAPARAAGSLPERWRRWLDAVDSVPPPRRDLLLRLRSRVVQVAQLGVRAAREPGKAVRRIVTWIR